MTIHHNRRHRPEDAPGVLGVILTSLEPLSNKERRDDYRAMLADFNRARMEPVAPILFPCSRREYTLTQQAREATPGVLRLVCRRGK
jgi:hypothetical protein